MHVPTLATPRLVLQPLTLADAPAIQQAFPRWEIVRFLADRVPWPYPGDGALAFVRDAALPAMAEGREWHWSLRPRQEPDLLIGVISLMDDPDNNRGFWMVPEWQGQGLMTEASEAVTAYWFEVLEKPRLRVPKAATNIPSSRISARNGMRIVATEERGYVSGRLPTEIWEITREEWLARR
ncbi:GNAT family N-acetyltransferase [Pigmentiphaga sp. NML080357]|uniref:GNAT family N-acetyltransferase n=1 Tax=Pigmentiphaga sp. NML080357 TaxID=2008675 RepID=UPI000B40EC37|nr:GNAT family N-acetyltransferase [Pigmentiphaga sp. NML080357]OVZ64936.1 GNAT family N-acetyltransferase [Pigmentiphaga sp. NML080357]